MPYAQEPPKPLPKVQSVCDDMQQALQFVTEHVDRVGLDPSVSIRGCLAMFADGCRGAYSVEVYSAAEPLDRKGPRSERVDDVSDVETRLDLVRRWAEQWCAPRMGSEVNNIGEVLIRILEGDWNTAPVLGDEKKHADRVMRIIERKRQMIAIDPIFGAQEA